MVDSQPPAETENLPQDDVSIYSDTSITKCSSKLSDSYDRRVAHTATITLVNNRYKILAILQFTLSPSASTINITKRPVTIFATIKIVDPSTTVIYP